MAERFSTAVLSLRDVRRFPWYAHIRATEDLFVETTGATRLDLQIPSGRTGLAAIDRFGHQQSKLRRAQTRLLRQVRRWPARLEPAPGSAPPADLGIMWASDLSDVGTLLDLDPVWTSFARTRVLVLSECWPGDLTMYGARIREVVEGFDAVFLCAENDVLDPIRESGTPLRYLPHGVVTDSYRPSFDGARPVTVLNYGRRDPAQHAALRAWEAATGGWYHYDSMGLGATPDPVDHQRVLGRLMSSSAFSVSNMGRFDEPHRTGGASEVGFRFYEALGAGCALLGTFPTSPIFDEHFGEAPGTVDFPLGSDGVPDEVDRLLADPDGMARIHRVHRGLALTHHDIAHRMAEVLDEVGFEVPTALAERQAALRSSANELLGA